MNINERFLVTINRELGTGGRSVGRKLAERLGVRLYDKVLLDGLVKEFGLSAEQIEELKGRKRGWWADFCDKLSRNSGGMVPESDFPETISSSDLYKAETRILGEIAAEESCVVTGRTAFHVLRSHPNKLRVFLRASMVTRIERVMARQNLSEAEAAEAIAKVDEGRENYVKRYTGSSRYDARNYDLVLNMDGLTVDDAVEVILDYIHRSGEKN